MQSAIKYRYPILAVAVLLAAAVVCVSATAAPTPSATSDRQQVQTCADTFTDVCPGDWFYSYVLDLYNVGAISGYPDSTFRPANLISRAQVMKVLVLALDLDASPPSSAKFADVPNGSTFYPFVEIGYANGLTSGYACGGPNEPCDPQQRPYFRPANNVTRAQLSKVIVIGAHLDPLSPPTATFADVPAGSTFYGYIERAVAETIISGYACGGSGEPCPGRYFRPNGTATRAQASKMISIARQHRATPTPTATFGPTQTPGGPTATPRPSNTPTCTPSRTVTSTPTNVVMPSATPGGPCPVLPADNIWNRNISALPTHVLSPAYMNSIGLNSHVHADFDSGLWQGEPIGIPYAFVPGTQPFVPIIYTAYGNQSDPGPFPIPTNAPIEGGPQSSGDRHVLIIDQGNCNLYELYSSYPQSDGSWEARSGARYDLNSNALRPAGWTSADAAGLPMYPGLVRYDEVASGAIHHALRFTVNNTQAAYIWPARHLASEDPNPNLPPMGLRVRLKASVDISGYDPQIRVILQAMKDYGMFVADNGSSWYISGAPDERWNNQLLHTMDPLSGTDFETVDESSLMIDPDSGQSR
jgi:S-layer homology domain